MIDALLSLSLADRFAVGVAALVAIFWLLFLFSLGGPVIVSWTWRWCQKAFREQPIQSRSEREWLDVIVRMGERR